MIRELILFKLEVKCIIFFSDKRIHILFKLEVKFTYIFPTIEFIIAHIIKIMQGLTIMCYERSGYSFPREENFSSS